MNTPTLRHIPSVAAATLPQREAVLRAHLSDNYEPTDDPNYEVKIKMVREDNLSAITLSVITEIFPTWQSNYLNLTREGDCPEKINTLWYELDRQSRDELVEILSSMEFMK